MVNYVQTILVQLPGGMVVNKRMYSYIENFLALNSNYSIKDLLGLKGRHFEIFEVELKDLSMEQFKKLFCTIIKLDGITNDNFKSVKDDVSLNNTNYSHRC